MNKLKYMFTLFLLLNSCAELIYNNKANINYDVYSSAFVYHLNTSTDFPLNRDKSLKYIVDKLETVSGFDQIYNQKDSPQMADSADLQIFITIKSYKWENYEDDDGDENYETKVKVQCTGIITRTGNTLFEFTEEGDEDEEMDIWDTEQEVDRDALEEALDDISTYFLKNFKI